MAMPSQGTREGKRRTAERRTALLDYARAYLERAYGVPVRVERRYGSPWLDAVCTQDTPGGRVLGIPLLSREPRKMARAVAYIADRCPYPRAAFIFYPRVDDVHVEAEWTRGGVPVVPIILVPVPGTWKAWSAPREFDHVIRVRVYRKASPPPPPEGP